MRTITLLSTVLCASVCVAEPDREFSDCANTAASVDRLSCFDSLAKARGALALPSTQTDHSGKWESTTSISPIDDSKTVVLRLPADEPVPVQSGRKDTPTLYLRCKEKHTEAYVVWNTFVGATEVRATYRFDKEKAIRRNWDVSTSADTVLIPRPIDAIREMMKRKSLLVELTPYGENPSHTTFTLSGLENVIEPLQEACGWK